MPSYQPSSAPLCGSQVVTPASGAAPLEDSVVQTGFALFSGFPHRAAPSVPNGLVRPPSRARHRGGASRRMWTERSHGDVF